MGIPLPIFQFLGPSIHFRRAADNTESYNPVGVSGNFAAPYHVAHVIVRVVPASAASDALARFRARTFGIGGTVIPSAPSASKEPRVIFGSSKGFLNILWKVNYSQPCGKQGPGQENSDKRVPIFSHLTYIDETYGISDTLTSTSFNQYLFRQ